MDEAEYCHRISIMISGKIAAIDSPQPLKQQNNCDTLLDAFLTIVEGGNREPSAHQGAYPQGSLAHPA